MTIKKSIMKVSLIIVGLLYSHLSFAGLNQDLNDYFNGLGFSSNVTSPQAYHGQQAGYYTGGSVFMRTPARNVQLIQMELPSYRSGCSGIDLFAGGFSFVDSDQLVQLMQNIMNNAGSYAFTLALETATPALANVMKYWNNFANTVNQANINSCETAESLVGGLWPKNSAAQHRVCQDLGNSSGLFTDWAQARQQCGRGNEFTRTMNKAKTDPRYKNLVFDSGNITWKAIKQNNLFGLDDELAQFFMSLSGTIIITKDGVGDDAPVKLSPPLPSLMDKEKNNLIKALLEGGEVTIYKCDTLDADGCLHPSSSGKISISKNQAFGNRIKNLLDDMVNKIIDDQPLTNEQIGLLQATSLPVYKMLNVQSAFSKDKNIIDVASYAEMIAMDILFQYLEQSLQVIRNNVSASQYSEAIIAELKPNIDKELAEIRALQKTAYSRIAISIQMIQQTQVIERMLAGDLSANLANNLSWARGLK
ncbi:MAG TPA: conjugal transfer protein TraH [Gammaproteobacteria bacterium]|jgi:conjugative transfer pilus assembly protein TraH|nr:conjugal transfer protein TraH [Gammaproteobacteria bacterium]